jgi:hypothetical protein
MPASTLPEAELDELLTAARSAGGPELPAEAQQFWADVRAYLDSVPQSVMPE